jgi:CHASE2 domain-containing sensor protein
VLATNAINSSANTTLFGVDPASSAKLLKAIGAQAGYVGFPPDPDGRLRRFDYSVGLSARAKQLTTLPVVAARMAGARVPKFGDAWIDYRGGPGTITTVSFADVVQGRIAPQRFRGKIVMVGATDPSLRDEHPSPADGGSTMAGPEILANAAWTAKHGLPLNTSRGVDFAAIVLLGLLPLATLRLRPWLTVIVCAGVALLFLIATQIAFDSGLIVSVVYPLLALVLSAAGVLGVRFALPRLAARRAARA